MPEPDALPDTPAPALPVSRRLTRRSVLVGAGLAGAAGLGIAVPLLGSDGGSGPALTDTGAIALEKDGTSLVVFSPDGRLLVTGSIRTGAVSLWDVAGRTWIAALTSAQPSRVLGVAFTPDGTTLAAAYVNGAVTLWDVPGHRRIADLTGHAPSVLGVAFSPDGRLLATSSVDTPSASGTSRAGNRWPPSRGPHLARQPRVQPRRHSPRLSGLRGRSGVRAAAAAERGGTAADRRPVRTLPHVPL